MSGDGQNPEERARAVRNMQDLLRFCVEGTAGEDAPGTSGAEMDPERRAWLEQAMEAFTVDLVKEMLEALANIKKELEKVGRDNNLDRDVDDSIDSIVGSVDVLLEHTEDLDLASDFEKIGGFQILRPLLDSSYPELQRKGAELVGQIVQNHERCQKIAVDRGLLDILARNMDSQNDSVQVKTLYAISCLIRANSEAQKVFVDKLSGFSVLLKAMQSTTPDGHKLRTKSAFLLGSMIGENEEFRKTLLDMGFIEQLVGLLHQERDQSHEHILSTLVLFVTGFPAALEEVMRPELQLQSLLTQKIMAAQGKPEYQEEEAYCRSLLQMLAAVPSSVNRDGADR